MGWDPIRKTYAAHLENCLHQRCSLDRRLIGRVESRDMIHWGVPETIIVPDEKDYPDTEFGHEVIIEERDPSEVLGENVTRVAVHNPAFDVTPANLVSAIITDRGIAHPPLAAALERLLTENNT